ncbi:sugar kinase [Nocardioides sp. KIGAM211]|uniref:Sugar kinase n=1 Tax=Nocardioides luti TaxID=2761101 RepID=A0A7X0RIL9_9ACTN|nr:sugar kinase [Nocardioides luti]MBB6627728.1 sugar kinase [Nocardioides luti]
MAGLLTLGETLALAGGAAVGSLAHVPSLQLGIGGAESNVAIGVRRLGGEAAWIGRVGADSLGERVLRELRAEGLALHATVDDTAPTALMVKERRTAATARVWYYRTGSAGSRLDPADVPSDLVAAASVLHVTGITPGLSASALAATERALDLAAEHGVPISFDVNHRAAVWAGRDPGPTYRSIAERSAVVFAGDDEARILLGTTATDPAELVAGLAGLAGGAASAGDAVLKLGADGCRARIDGVDHEVAAVPVAVVDSVGAGDAFVAGYLAELMAGRPAATRLATAVRCGAFACLTTGDWEGLPRRAELALLDGGEPVVR